CLGCGVYPEGSETGAIVRASFPQREREKGQPEKLNPSEQEIGLGRAIRPTSTHLTIPAQALSRWNATFFRLGPGVGLRSPRRPARSMSRPRDTRAWKTQVRPHASANAKPRATAPSRPPRRPV